MSEKSPRVHRAAGAPGPGMRLESSWNIVYICAWMVKVSRQQIANAGHLIHCSKSLIQQSQELLKKRDQFPELDTAWEPMAPMQTDDGRIGL